MGYGKLSSTLAIIVAFALLQKLNASCSDYPSDIQNVALGRPATQSSNYLDNGFTPTADLAVDGDKNPNYSGLSCSVTTNAAGVRAWWQVDLGVRYKVAAVTITNRGDSVGERLADFDVTVYKTNPITNSGSTAVTCYHHTGPLQQGVTATFPCTSGPVFGRFVRITNKASEFLQLCEVAVWAPVERQLWWSSS